LGLISIEILAIVLDLILIDKAQTLYQKLVSLFGLELISLLDLLTWPVLTSDYASRHRFPPDIISYAVWLYYRFNRLA
jgi:hypothetical protein